MIIRAVAGHDIRVPAAEGTRAELRVQDRYLSTVVATGETDAVWGAAATVGLHWGRRSRMQGEVWLGKTRHELVVTR